MSKTLYAIKNNISGFYWNEKKETWTCHYLDPDIWNTKEELQEIQNKYAEFGLFDETIIERVVAK